MSRRILVLETSKNVHGNDAQGAFVPQAIHFKRFREKAGDVVELVPFDNTIPSIAKRAANFVGMIGSAHPFDAFVYFGHGLRTSLPSAGITLQTIDLLAAALASRGSSNLIVTLFACSAGETTTGGVDGDGGFADVLRDRLSVAGHTGWIDAHTVAGHTTINRYARRFYMDGHAAGTGGTWLVAPGSPEWKAWGDDLELDEAFRFAFSYMTEAEIHAYLAAHASPPVS